jgi:hypothetical protein
MTDDPERDHAGPLDLHPHEITPETRAYLAACVDNDPAREAACADVVFGGIAARRAARDRGVPGSTLRDDLRRFRARFAAYIKRETDAGGSLHRFVRPA